MRTFVLPCPTLSHFRVLIAAAPDRVIFTHGRPSDGDGGQN
ncbi:MULTISPECIES: hypothetical protein [Sphingomonas]|nr:hypothetical protein [Sphingomonas sp. Leaf28]